MHEQTPGITFMIKLEPPEADPIEVKAQTLSPRSAFGFAVRFIDMDEETSGRLKHVLDQLQEQARRPAGSAPRQPEPEPLILPLSASLRSADADTRFPDLAVPSRPADERAADRPRAARVGMLGSGYQVQIDGQTVALVNLSLSGVQIRGSIRLLPDQPSIVKIGWPLEEMACAAIARVRWVRVESGPSKDEEVYRAGLVFETWEVQRLKKIMHHRGRSVAGPAPDANSPS